MMPDEKKRNMGEYNSNREIMKEEKIKKFRKISK